MTVISVHAHLVPVIIPTAAASADASLQDRIYAPIVTAWLGHAERFFTHYPRVDMDSMSLKLMKGIPHLEVNVKVTIDESSPAFPLLQAWNTGHGRGHRALLDSAAAKLEVLKWVEDHLKAVGAHHDFNMNITADDFTVVKEAAAEPQDSEVSA